MTSLPVVPDAGNSPSVFGQRAGEGEQRSVWPTLATRLDPRNNSLNAIRLVLASAVIVSHSYILGARYGHTPVYFGETLGGWAVFAFFVLSGYLITGSRLSTDFGAFLRRRVLRIYPGFVGCLVMTVVVFGPIAFYQKHRTLDGYLTTKTTPIDYVLTNITMRMETYHVAGTPYNSHDWTGSLWSLYYEFLCYLMVGLLVFWKPFRRSPVVAIVLLVVVTLARVEFSHWSQYAPGLDVSLLLRLVPYFLAGSVLYFLRDRIPCTWWLAALAALALICIAAAGGRRYGSTAALPMGYLLLYIGAVVPVRIGRRNDISYGMYMYGYPVEQVLRLAKIDNHLLYTVLAIAVTVPCAAASWVLIERPFMRLGRGRRPPPPPREESASPSSEPSPAETAAHEMPPVGAAQGRARVQP